MNDSFVNFLEFGTKLSFLGFSVTEPQGHAEFYADFEAVEENAKTLLTITKSV
jgi:hypothetical protein